MSIDELTQKIEAQAKSRTHEERLRLLRDARILDQDGRLDRNFFRLEENLRHDHALSDMA
ncbi:hypothetical protein [Thalassospira sp. TSL5-1]|uniref:hypothetical protein n=1 Tax=Thalassospira sp. TSL5-1 TaxID=1544451 RepID=UPI00093D1E2D|nr:hypothetical protein [Thalassospira sp. TSL5-1]OKH89080.1 hypothetical protein LF95_03215 [Thalassospira sp. TSL5-1]